MSPAPILAFAGWANDGSEFSRLFATLGEKPVRTVTLSELCDQKTAEEGRCRRRALSLAHASESLPHSEAAWNLIGWSLGAMLALQFAAEHPERVNRMVLFSGTFSFIERPEWNAGLPERTVLSLAKGIARDRESSLRDFFRLCGAVTLDEIESRLERAARFSQEELLAGLSYLVTSDLRSIATGIRCPVLLIHGKRDRIIPADASREIFAALPHADLMLIPEVGHLLPEELSETGINDVASFLHN